MKLCPRARYSGNKSRFFRVSLDPALLYIAKMIVAGADKKHSLHPEYRVFLKNYGEQEAKEYIEGCVTPGGGSVLQTSMGLGGCGLFGAKISEGTRFVFYEWTSPSPRFRVCLTTQDARDILSGRKKTVRFIFCTKKYFARRKRTEKRYYAKFRKKNKST